VKFQENYTAASAELNGQQAKRNDLGAWEVDLNTLTQERDRLQTRYASLSDRLQDLEIRKNARAQTIRVIEAAAMPRKPVQPQPVLNLAISLILGLIIAAGVVFLQEYLDDRINEPEDVERLCALPSLGHVPLISGEQTRLVSALSANSPAGEAYRALRSSIGFAGLDAPIRRLQLTSASKGEGKSTTALNLATAMAIDGKRVILVDADLRRPSIHRMLDLPPSPGLSELLVGMKTLDEALQPTDVENLWVVAAGPIPPNPAELLGTRAFERIIEQLEERADIVIFDSPPCIPVTDPMVIATRMHGVVLVVHPGQTRKPVIKHTVELLERARARIVGVVFNRIEATRGGYYHQYYTDGYYSDSHQNGDSSRRNGKSHSLKGEGSDKLVSVARDGSDES
jgi:capsular exopolysaccharide synthesis family protein